MRNVSKSGKCIPFLELPLRALRKRLEFRKNYVLRNYSS